MPTVSSMKKVVTVCDRCGYIVKDKERYYSVSMGLGAERIDFCNRCHYEIVNRNFFTGDTVDFEEKYDNRGFGEPL